MIMNTENFATERPDMKFPSDWVYLPEMGDKLQYSDFSLESILIFSFPLIENSWKSLNVFLYIYVYTVYNINLCINESTTELSITALE